MTAAQLALLKPRLKKKTQQKPPQTATSWGWLTWHTVLVRIWRLRER